MLRDDFAVFILTHGRAENVVTADTLKRQKFPERSILSSTTKMTKPTCTVKSMELRTSSCSIRLLLLPVLIRWTI